MAGNKTAKAVLVFLLLTVCLGLGAQTVSDVQGVITDKTGAPVAGAVVWIRGTQISSISDQDGYYSLSFTGDYDTISVSVMGYKPQTLPITKGKQTVDIVLEDEVNELDEVVVVGMNNRQTKRSITGAVSIIQTQELVQSPVANISNALAGKLPGLMTVQYSGEPGADAATLYIRGLGTYGTSAPLVVIDGLPRNKNDLDMIDPNEVESITILKDAASSSLYGIQGANGVVVVTTRRGGGEEQPRISVNIQQALQQPIRLPQIMSSYDQALYNRALDYNNGQPLTYSDEVIEALRTGSDPYLYPSTNWFDVVLKDHSWQQQYNVNVSGSTGNKFKVNYFISGSYVRQGTLLNHEDEFESNYGVKAKYDRVNFRSNLDVQVTRRMNVRIDLAARLETRVGPSQSFSYIFGQITNRLPASQAVFNPDGSLAAGSGLVNPSHPGNPYGVLTRSGYYNNGSNVLYGTVSAKYDLDFLLRGLTLQGFFSFENTANLNRYWSQEFEQKWYRGLDVDGNPVYQDYTTEGRLAASTGTYVERYSYYDVRL
ncbi:MAG: SusC/RagA family TonB-linked outer membrane protein, partial [Bacteroidales bacterium]|nr:SusC/RagA family TonB-linked outer membrane protein [Bacteroidales bacterium]